MTGDDIMIVNKGIVRQRMKKDKASPKPKQGDGGKPKVKKKKYEQVMDLQQMIADKKKEQKQ